MTLLTCFLTQEAAASEEVESKDVATLREVLDQYDDLFMESACDRAKLSSQMRAMQTKASRTF